MTFISRLSRSPELLFVLLSTSCILRSCLFGMCDLNTMHHRSTRFESELINGEWLKWSGSNTLYHFSSHMSPMNWFQAFHYCNEKGGYLVEITESRENDFLVWKAKELEMSNWWIGLRATEHCQCRVVINVAPLNSKFDQSQMAALDKHCLMDPTFVGEVRSECPINRYHVCFPWTLYRWARSGQKADFTSWSPGHPRSSYLACTGMWHGNKMWGSYYCQQNDNRGWNFAFQPFYKWVPFRAICEKDVDAGDESNEEVMDDGWNWM